MKTPSVRPVKGIPAAVLLLASMAFSINSTPTLAQSINPPEADVLAAGGSGTISVTTSGAWTATSDDDWIQITSPAPGATNTGNGTVQYNVQPLPDNLTNINHSTRLGTLTIAGQNFTVRQHPSGQMTYDDWAAALPAGAKGPGQDASGTGIPNFVKYAFGLDPTRPSESGLPMLSVSNGVASFLLTKPSSVVGVRYNLQSTEKLAGPASNNVPLTRISGNNPTEIWQASMPASGDTGFLLSSVVPVGVTAREVQKAVNAALNTFSTNQTLWTIQPGLGTVMIEYGRRFALMKLAADAGAWDMAQYQLTEATEIQEVGEITRAARAPLLKDFESNYLDPLAEDILAKDSASFTTHFNEALEGCNACHVGTSHGYVVVQTPTNSPESFLQFIAGNPKAPGTNAPAAPISPASDTPLTWAEVQQQVDQAFNAVDRRLTLWNIQPGLGTVMMEYGRRFALVKLAADAGDWGMAQYQLTEATEIQEVGETTRPANAPLLKDFEGNYLDPLMQDILGKDAAGFATHYQEAVEGCNACHQGTGHGYVVVRNPLDSPQPFLKLAASDPTPPGTNTAPPVVTPTFPVGAPELADAQNIISNRLNTVDRSLALWNIQPGLGTVMMEYGYRFALAYLAAGAGNWGMAGYQIQEATEIQEVGETTRPANAPLLKDFETTYLDPIKAAITAKDKSAFETAYASGVEGCNACHQATRHGYVRYETPSGTLADFLNLGSGQ